MNNSRTIETVRSSDLVTFKILIEGTELSAVHQVKNISVEKEINRIPFAQVVFLDGEAASQNFNLSNEDLLVPGKNIEIKAGYHNDVETIFKGIIIKHSIKIRENNSVLIVECRDEAVKMTIGTKSNFYYESKDSDIIEEIIGKYGLQSDIETTSFTNKEMVQYRTSDWDFMMTRAQLNGQICTVDDGKIIISKPDLSQDEVETVAFGATLLDFDAEMDARNQFNSITAYGWNPSEQEIVEAEATDPGISLNGNISTSDLAEVIDHENLELKHGGNYNLTQLQNWSDAKSLFQQLSKTRGRVKFQGIPTVKPGTMLKLEGVGNRFNGKIFISAVRHEIVNGNWTVDAEFGMNPKWFSETYDISELPAAGILPAVSGLQVGVVSQLESDPDGEDRILVKIPIIDKDEQGIWTRIATLDAGNNRGSFFLPEIGDEVIVGFVNDDPNHAVILGMLHSSAKPAPLTASDDNHEKGFVTRSELKLIFNDEKKSIIIETPGGKKVTIDEDAGVIKIEDDNRNIITMGNGGIAMESGKDFSIKATGDCNIEAMNVNVKANAQFKAQGNAGAEVSTSAIAVLKGSLVQIN
ncbi:MAG: type IV secretion protein Rhs [Aequorivita sp.]|jgi:Rhs element Vgr protein|nr:type IV secretion protein Rhs [Aequorivita sp.]MBP42457.1 type IV secretion protein Rhs [Aequorivita sp.]HBC05608.1 Rhs element Vgr protein [Aequorivita sp.]|tara:strand:+ start:2212 stop:3957 length:1746 start_codon:yes stop_codon:yes gene_type:complete